MAQSNSYTIAQKGLSAEVELMRPRGIKQEVRQRRVQNGYEAIFVTFDDRSKPAQAGFCFATLPVEKCIDPVCWSHGISSSNNRVNNEQDSENLLNPLNVADTVKNMIVERV